MKKIPGLILLLLLCQIAISQRIQKAAANSFKLNVGNFGTTVIGSDDKFLYLQSLHTKFMISQSQKIVNIPSLTRISKETLEPEKTSVYKDQIEKRDWVAFHFVKDRIFIFTTEKSSKTELSFYATEINKENLQPKGETRMLGAFPINKDYDRVLTTVIVAEDSSRFLLVVEGEKENPAIQAAVVDLDLKATPVISLSLQSNSKSLDRTGLWLLSNETILVRGNLMTEIQEGRKKRYQLAGFSSKFFDLKGKKIAEQTEEVKERLPMVSYIKENAKKQIEMIGFYANNPTERILSGVYYKLLDLNTTTTITEKYLPFTNLDPAITKKLNEDNSFRLKNISSTPDGKNSILVAESYREMDMSRVESNGRAYYRTDLFYRDLLIVQFNPTDKINWTTLLPKNQITMVNAGNYWWNLSFWKPFDHFPGTSSGLYGSITTIARRDAFYVLFNDDSDNSNVTTPDAKVSRAGGATGNPHLLKIDYQTGKMSRSVLSGIPKGMGLLTPKTVGSGDAWYLLSREHTGFGLSKFDYHFSLLRF